MGINNIPFNFFDFVLTKHFQHFFLLSLTENLINFLYISKHSIFLKFNCLIDLFVSDYLFYTKRFKICYNLSSSFYLKTFFIMYSLMLLETAVSIYTLFDSSIWLEREAFDMFGIIFINNWDLRKILTDYTFFGFPLRKDFPLSGYFELIYSEVKKCTFETLLELMQELRFFISPSFIEFWDVQ